MKVMSVVGARPQFVKLAPMAAALARAEGFEHVIVHTGQHYDANMSADFFDSLHIPPPDVQLEVGSGSHGSQTGSILRKLEPVLSEVQPDWTLVYGDTNSTLAAALAAVKLHFPVAHLEAGLRSFNRTMPEEHNRVLTDHASDLLLAPTQQAMGHLAREGLTHRAVLVGDVMTDVCFQVRDRVATKPVRLPDSLDARSPFVIATIHRASNTDDAERLADIVAALRRIDAPVILTAHPRLVAKARAFSIDLTGGALHPCPPLAYPAMVQALMASAGVVTDSGGLQKEAYLLGVPCTTLRNETEWSETLVHGWNILDPELTRLTGVALRPRPPEVRQQVYGDGHAAAAVVEALQHQFPLVTS